MKEKLSKLLNAGMNMKQIAKEVNLTYDQVRGHLKKHNLKPNGSFKKGDSFIKDYKCSCGETDKKKFYGDQKKKCKICHVKKTSLYQRKNKQFAVDYMGGECLYCGYSKSLVALQFHHLDPTEKDIKFKSFTSWGRERMILELGKCILLCANCHAEEHERLLS